MCSFIPKDISPALNCSSYAKALENDDPNSKLEGNSLKTHKA
jgi:hypothetical protein